MRVPAFGYRFALLSLLPHAPLRDCTVVCRENVTDVSCGCTGLESADFLDLFFS